MPLLDMDGKENGFTELTGGFVPYRYVWKKQMMYLQDYLKNEFVFTADAVRNAGEGRCGQRRRSYV